MVQLRRFFLPMLATAATTSGAFAQTMPAPAPAPTSVAGASVEPKPVAKPQPASPQVGTSAVVLDISAVAGVIGMGVKSYEGEDLGHIVDLLVTPAGQVRAAVLQFGGVLGVGDRKVAVDWGTLDFKTMEKGGEAILALTRNQIRVSPEYKAGDPVVVLETTKKPAPAIEAAKADTTKAGPDKSGSAKMPPIPVPPTAKP
jgi:hypothetical protein